MQIWAKTHYNAHSSKPCKAIACHCNSAKSNSFPEIYLFIFKISKILYGLLNPLHKSICQYLAELLTRYTTKHCLRFNSDLLTVP